MNTEVGSIASTIRAAQQPHYFTQYGSWIIQMHSRHTHTFSLLATDTTDCWAANFRHRHLLPDERSSLNVQNLFQSFSTSFDNGSNVGNITKSDEGNTLSVEVVFSHHGIEYRVTFTLAAITGSDKSVVMSSVMTELYNSMSRWRATSMNQLPKTNKLGKSRSDSPDKESTTGSIKKSSMSKPSTAASPSSNLNPVVWKPTSHPKGYFSQPMPTTPGRILPAVGNLYSGVPAELPISGWSPPWQRKAGHETKAELKIQLLAQRQAFDVIKQELQAAANKPKLGEIHLQDNSTPTKTNDVPPLL